MKVFLFCLILLNSAIFAQNNNSEESSNFIGINSELSYNLLDQNQDLRKVKILIDNKNNGAFDGKKLIIGASIIGILWGAF